MSKIFDLIKSRRSIRKFRQKKIDKEILQQCMEAGRLAPSVANMQPLKFICITKGKEMVFKYIKFAGCLPDYVLEKNERPVAYILITTKIDKTYDLGFAAENIILTALSYGISSCVLCPTEKARLGKALNLKYRIEMVIALGYPKQRSVIEKFKGSTQYWLDEEGIMHVPKKDKVIIK